MPSGQLAIPHIGNALEPTQVIISMRLHKAPQNRVGVYTNL